MVNIPSPSKVLPSGGEAGKDDSWAECQKRGREGSEGARRVKGRGTVQEKGRKGGIGDFIH